MRDLVIKGNDRSPSIIFKPAENKFVIGGESRPEDARKYFHPVVEWIEDFSHFTALHKGEEKNIYHFDFRMEYMNSISTKIIYDLLKKLEALPHATIIINWHYASDDVDMQENGQEYSQMVNLKFEFYPYEEQA